MLLPGFAQENQSRAKRLILKDGSYELITEYQIRGDRVRYFSSERNSWEELPDSLVDWDATERFARGASREASERKSEALERAGNERREEEARKPIVAQGLQLPSPDGVYLLDLFRGQPELNPLAQNGADLNKNTGRNILRGVINPIAGPRQTVELTGLNALIQSHSASPSIYFPFDPGDSSAGYDSKTAKDHLRIVRCGVKKDNRVVGVVNIALYGKVKEHEDYVDAVIEPVSEYWAKITPVVPLKPGEYALVEYDEKGAMNQYVWDFGVNPAAPANLNTMRPILDRSEPVLIQKPLKKTNP
jgi:hypothetical protein